MGVGLGNGPVSRNLPFQNGPRRIRHAIRYAINNLNHDACESMVLQLQGLRRRRLAADTESGPAMSTPVTLCF